jgi:hypothetical protein
MRKFAFIAALSLAASPAFAASKNPFSAEFWTLTNTDLIVAISFFVFIGVLIYFKVPTIVGDMLDKRAEGIKSDLAEARADQGLARGQNALLIQTCAGPGVGLGPARAGCNERDEQ